MKLFKKSLTAGLVLVLAVSGVLGLTPQTAEAFSGSGAGTVGNPYIITSCAQLQEMKDALAAYYKLGSNVNCDVAPYNTGSGFEPVGNSGTPFTGSLNGNGYTISGLFINRPATDNIGLFGYTNTGAVIANVGLVGVNVTGQIYTGGLVGFKAAGTVEGSYSKGTVAGDRNVGGLVGFNVSTTVKTSYSTAAVSSTGSSGDVGGLVGLNSGTVQDSYATGNVSGSNANVYAGGLVGYTTTGTIQNSYATGNVSVTGGSSSYAGGLTGFNIMGSVANSYATGTATADEGDANDGGLIGNNMSTVTNSFSVGAPPVGSGSSTGATGGQSLSSFYQTDPLKAVYTGSPAWNFGDIWHFANASSLPILEAVQPPVTNAVLSNAVDGKLVSITTPAGTNLTCSSATKDSSLAKRDTGYLYPDGLVKFCFDTTSSNNQVTVVFVTNLTPSQVVARKYNSVTQTYATISDATVSATTFEGQPAISVTYDIVDNGPLDENPAVGAITDPVGLAVAETAATPEAPKTGYGSSDRPNTAIIVLAAGAVIALAGASRLLYKSSRPV